MKLLGLALLWLLWCLCLILAALAWQLVLRMGLHDLCTPRPSLGLDLSTASAEWTVVPFRLCGRDSFHLSLRSHTGDETRRAAWNGRLEAELLDPDGRRHAHWLIEPAAPSGTLQVRARAPFPSPLLFVSAADPVNVEAPAAAGERGAVHAVSLVGQPLLQQPEPERPHADGAVHHAAHILQRGFAHDSIGSLPLAGGPWRPWQLRARVLAPAPEFSAVRTELGLGVSSPGTASMMALYFALPAAGLTLLALLLAAGLAATGTPWPLWLSGSLAALVAIAALVLAQGLGLL
jgi:hypothetical protein